MLKVWSTYTYGKKNKRMSYNCNIVYSFYYLSKRNDFILQTFYFFQWLFFRIGDCWPLRHRLYKKKGQIHSYPSRARMGWGNDKKGALSFCLSVCCYVNLSVHPSVYWSAGNVWVYKWKNNHFTSFFFWIGCGGNLDVDGSWLLCPLICNDIVTPGHSLQDKLFKKKNYMTRKQW